MAADRESTRRHFLRTSAAVGGAFLALRHLAGCGTHTPTYSPDPLEGLLRDPDNILHLPKGFSYRALSRTGEKMDDGFLVPAAHDGMAAFPGPDGRTVIIRNHELTPQELRLGGPFGPRQQLLKKLPREKIFDFGNGKLPGLGGTTTLVYDTRGQLLEKQFLSLAGTWRNCAGGPTPWGSWITCEETVQRKKDNVEQDHGWCFEVPASATEPVDPVPLKAMGRRPVALRCQGKVTRVVEQEEQRYGIGATIERFEFIHLDSHDGKPGKMKNGFPDLSGL